MKLNLEKKKIGREDALTALSSLSEEDFNETVNTLKRRSYFKDDIQGELRQEREESVVKKCEEMLVSLGMEHRHAWTAIVAVVRDISR